MLSIDELRLSSVVDLKEANKEYHLPEAYTASDAKEILPPEVSKRFQFSYYLIDPNNHFFSKVVRIIVHVIKFITCSNSPKMYHATRSISNQKKKKSLQLSPEDIKLVRLISSKNVLMKKHIFFQSRSTITSQKKSTVS